MRDKLIESITKSHCVDTWNHYTDDFKEPNPIYELADYLLADGWMRPPCKVGQILFIIEAGLIYEAKVKECKYCSNSTNGIHCHIIFEELFVMSEAHIGKTIFYTREEAEATLKGGATYL